MSQRRRKQRDERKGGRSPRAQPRGGGGGGGPDPRLKLEPVHMVLVALGVLVAVLGFWLLSRGSISAAPALLLLAFLVLIPVGLALPTRDGSPKRSDGG